MIGKWRKCLDNGVHGSALLTGLSKAFDFIDYRLLIAKLNAYGVDTNSLSLREKYPITELILVRIFPHSDQKKLRIWTLFTQCILLSILP